MSSGYRECSSGAFWGVGILSNGWYRPRLGLYPTVCGIERQKYEYFPALPAFSVGAGVKGKRVTLAN